MRSRIALATAATAAALIGGIACSGAQSQVTSVSVVRVNQLGWAPSDTKVAYALSARGGNVPFSVVSPSGSVVLTGRSHHACASWNRRWLGCTQLDLSALRARGSYRVQVGSASSPTFRVAPRTGLYAASAANAVTFLQAQRDGANVIPGALGRRPAHLSDASARVYTPPRFRGGQIASSPGPTNTVVNLAGGWFDAGDYLKFAGTSSFTDVLLLFTLREYGTHLPFAAQLAQEARFGTDWLLKTWDMRRRVLYEQVGIGDGNIDTMAGDHDLWRLPERDDHAHGRALRFIAHRPVFAANRPGSPVSPNLAGREAAAFGLCAQVFRTTDPAYAHRCLLAGQTLFDAAGQRWRGGLAGSIPSSYYSEREWRDDMQLAATELYLATLSIRSPDLPHREPYPYLETASSWANDYQASPSAGADSLNLYNVAPLADFDLYRAMVASGNTTSLYTNASSVLADLRDTLSLASRLSRRGPFGLADVAAPVDTVAHALGVAASARLYGALTGSSAFAGLAGTQLDWVLGDNPWGSSFVIGTGAVFPHCPAHQVANLRGSLRGTSPLLTGAVVPGPTATYNLTGLGAPDGYRRCSASAPFTGFTGHGFGYRDDVRSSASSEPSDDLAGLSLLAFGQQSAGLPRAAQLTIPR